MGNPASGATRRGEMDKEEKKLCPMQQAEVSCGKWCAWWADGGCVLVIIAKMLTKEN